VTDGHIHDTSFYLSNLHWLHLFVRPLTVESKLLSSLVENKAHKRYMLWSGCGRPLQCWARSTECFQLTWINAFMSSVLLVQHLIFSDHFSGQEEQSSTECVFVWIKAQMNWPLT